MIINLVLLVPLAYTLVSSFLSIYFLLPSLTDYFQGARYNIPNQALIGACFIASGVGNMG